MKYTVQYIVGRHEVHSAVLGGWERVGRVCVGGGGRPSLDAVVKLPAAIHDYTQTQDEEY